MILHREITDKWNSEIEKIAGVGLSMSQRAELSKYFRDEVKNIVGLDNVRLSSKAETIRVVRNRAEHFENIGNHKHAETECRCAVDIIERLVPPENFQDEA